MLSIGNFAVSINKSLLIDWLNAFEGFSHVGGLCAQPDTRLTIEPDHLFWLSRSSTPLPRLRTMFQPESLARESFINEDRFKKLGSLDAESSLSSGFLDKRLRQLQKLA